MSETDTARPPEPPQGRWPFIRDVLVLQLKLLLGNLHNLLLIPATTIAALIDLIHKGDRHGSRFYKMLELGRQADEMIGLYAALDRDEERLKSEYSVDAVVAQLEGVIVREYEKGGTAASMKTAIDAALDRLHSKGEKGAAKALDAAGSVIKKIAPPPEPSAPSSSSESDPPRNPT